MMLMGLGLAGLIGARRRKKGENPLPASPREGEEM